MKVWGGRGMSGQNDTKSRGLSLAQPITPQWVRKKSIGQTKGGVKNAIMEDMQLPTDKLASQQWDFPTIQKEDSGDVSAACSYESDAFQNMSKDGGNTPVMNATNSVALYMLCVCVCVCHFYV